MPVPTITLRKLVTAQEHLAAIKHYLATIAPVRDLRTGLEQDHLVVRIDAATYQHHADKQLVAMTLERRNRKEIFINPDGTKTIIVPYPPRVTYRHLLIEGWFPDHYRN